MKVRILENPRNPKGLAASFPYSSYAVDQIKKCLGFSWDAKLKTWLSSGPETLLDLQRFGIQVEMNSAAKKIAEEFRQQLWDTIDCRSLPIDDEPYAYQKHGSKYLSIMSHSILGDSPGVGKTKQSLDAAMMLNPEYILVLCKNTLTYNWLDEIDKWQYPLVAGVIPDTSVKRKAFWDSPPQIVIANYEKIRLTDWPFDRDWDVVILDEIQTLKNSSSLLWKAMRRMVPRIKYLWGLTGTPMEKNIEELYNLFSLLRPSVFGNFSRFKAQHIVTDWSGQTVGIKNIELLRERIGPFILRRTKEEVLRQLPEKIYENHYIDFSPSEEKAYKEFKSLFNNFLDKYGVSGKGNPLVESLRMRQFCCTPMIFTQDLGRGTKFEELEDILRQHDGRAVVFCFFEEVISMMVKWLGLNPEAVISGPVAPAQRVQRVKKFNAGLLGPVLLSTDAGNMGLNITGANLIVHYDQIFVNPMKMHQREDRLHRIGQKDNVTVINMLYANSIDTGTYLANREEEETFRSVIEGAEELMLRRIDAARWRRIVEGKN